MLVTHAQSVSQVCDVFFFGYHTSLSGISRLHYIVRPLVDYKTRTKKSNTGTCTCTVPLLLAVRTRTCIVIQICISSSQLVWLVYIVSWVKSDLGS